VRLEGGTALVTGGSSGIGRATALALATEGMRVDVTGRDLVRLREVAAATGGAALPADLLDAGQVAVLEERLARQAPDVLVLCAGAGLRASLDETTDEQVRHLLRLNLEVPIALARATVPGMRARGSGALVFVTSIAAVLGVGHESAYATSKGGLQVFAASLAQELTDSGVRVMTVVPGVVATEFFERRGNPYGRSFPRPVSPGLVAERIVTGLRHDKARVVVPGWMRLPLALSLVAPRTYAALAGRTNR
jgi:short-subunit dehydrogenase